MGDVLGELMGIYETLLESFDDKDNGINNSSIYLDTIMFEAANKVAEPHTECINNFKTTISKLCEQIDFLKEELKEKNLLIKSLIFFNANECKKINRSIVDDQFVSSVEVNESNYINDTFLEENNETPLSIIYDGSFEDNNETILNSTVIDAPYPTEQTSIDGNNSEINADMVNDASILSDSNNNTKLDEKYEWQKSSSGFARKMFEKMGYKGRGLGKSEDGITEPISITKLAKFTDSPHKEIRKRKMIYIASGSMLNQIDETRLSKHFDVKVRCHGGCTIKCMYTHLPDMFKLKPEYVILHIGSNDCPNKTSDEIIRELNNLIAYIKRTLPSSKITYSLPTVRTDCSKAEAIRKNFNVKMKRSNNDLLENSNIQIEHLGRKGLHFNDHGVKLMARNIISLIKRF